MRNASEKKQQIEMRALESLVEYENNPRKNDKAVNKVASAIRDFGFRVPILIHSDGRIIDGHLRYKAAKVAGLDEVPCLQVDNMSQEKIRAFRISINKMAELADWDEALLVKELEYLQSVDFDLEMIGYEEHELDAILGDPDPEEGDDSIPVAPITPVSMVGDLWLLGEHSLLCGDSTSMEDMNRLVDNSPANMVFTDPPYNVDYSGRAGKIKNDKMTATEFDDFLNKTFFAMAAAILPGAPVYVAHADFGLIGVSFRTAFVNAGFHLAACLIWKKNQATVGRSDYQWIHEPILYGWRAGGPHKWYGGRKKTTATSFKMGCVRAVSADEIQVVLKDEILTVTGKDLQVRSDLPTIINENKPLRNDDHPTMKPVALVERFIKNSSRPGDIILDQFGGSGTTLIAADKLGRVARIMELDPKFVDVIVHRWQKYSGSNAVLADDGRIFAEICEERRR